MKFSLFVHMERISPDKSHQTLYEEYLTLCDIADKGGMYAIWTGEHHGMDFTIAPNPFVSIADLARRTTNVRLGTGTVVAPFWHPIKLAGESAMADLISNGRLDLGLARGAYSFEYERLMPGMDAWEAGQRMRETAPLLRQLWQGDCAHEGEFYQFPATTSAPKPVQDGGPPIWVAARDPNSHDFAVANDFNVQVTPLWQGDEEISSLMERFNAACQAHDRRPEIMLLQHIYVGENETELRRAATDFNRFYNYFGAWFQNKRPISQGMIAPLSADELQQNELFLPDTLRQTLAIGTAEQIIDRLKNYEQMGYDQYAYWIDSGMAFEDKVRSLKRFIADVMPAFG